MIRIKLHKHVRGENEVVLKGNGHSNFNRVNICLIIHNVTTVLANKICLNQEAFVLMQYVLKSRVPAHIKIQTWDHV